MNTIKKVRLTRVELNDKILKLFPVLDSGLIALEYFKEYNKYKRYNDTISLKCFDGNKELNIKLEYEVNLNDTEKNYRYIYKITLGKYNNLHIVSAYELKNNDLISIVLLPTTN